MEATAAGSQLVSLFPTHSASWWPMVEDMLSSPPLAKLKAGLLDECMQRDEFRFLSLDGTVKCVLPIMGQSQHASGKRRSLGDDCFEKD